VKIAARARRIGFFRFGGRNRVLLVAPTTNGGFCTSLSGPYGGVGCTLPRNRLPKSVLNPGMTGDATGPILFHGYFTVPHAARLQVIFADGSTGTIPFAWVTEPIRAGFFVYDLSAHRRRGRRPVALSVWDRHGKRLYEQRVSG
jgi:hypothetical protein